VAVFGKRGILWSAWLVPAALLAGQPVAAAKPAPTPAPVDQDYAPKPGLWLLADEDTKIYLFGTTHLLAPGFKWRSPAVDKAAAEADELVVETLEEPDAEPDMAMMLAILLEKPVPVLDRVPADRRKMVAKAFKDAGVKLDDMAMLRTWMVSVLLGYAQELKGWGVSEMKDAPGVEDALEAQFRAAGKPISAVETADAGLEAFNALPEAEQVKLLLEAAAPVEESEEAETDSDDLWAQGRYEEAYARDMADFPPALFDGLVVKRNAAWVEWLGKRLEKPGTMLFAVGAAHLAGPESVQKMLARRGLQTKRVD
jgi:hypothetical protein